MAGIGGADASDLNQTVQSDDPRRRLRLMAQIRFDAGQPPRREYQVDDE